MRDDIISSNDVLKQLGARIARHRLNRNLTQMQVAQRSGISVATLKRMEHGSTKILLVNLANVLRTLGLDGGFDLLIPDVPASPIQLTALQNRTRQRAGRKKKGSPEQDDPTWTWAQ